MGSQTGKIYGFSKFQVNKRAPKICKECELINNCPIENWPEIMSISSKDIKVDLDIEKNFGPKTVLTSDQKPDFVWINGESLGDEDPALNNLSDLPVVFIFDIKLLKSLDLSTKRIIFLLDTLKEINEKRELKVTLLWQCRRQQYSRRQRGDLGLGLRPENQAVDGRWTAG